MILCLSGYARSGKDTAAEFLVKKFGFEKLAFADPLREMLYAQNPIVGIEHWNTLELRTHQCRLQEVIDLYGWDGYKKTRYADEIRSLIQQLGTEGGRNILGENVWVDATMARIDPNLDYVISDGRYFNEFDAVHEAGGRIVRIDRPGVEPINNHSSERAAAEYPRFDYLIDNDGTLEDLHDKVRELIDQLEREGL